MSDRIDPADWPSPRGPWPEVTDNSRLYDHGRAWCVNAHAHPDPNDGYPDRDRHLPWHECRGVETYLDGARSDLDGEPVGVGTYVAAAFRFGELREGSSTSAPRVVIETWRLDTDEIAERVSLAPATALHLARILMRAADDLTFGGRAGHSAR
jgi:hypothetical protein